MNKSFSITLLLTATLLSLLLSVSNLFSAKVDWNNYYWKKQTVTPNSLENSYWLEFYFLPDNPKYGYACGTWMGGLSQSTYDSPAVFARTTDSGKTWQASLVDGNKPFHAESVIFTDSMRGYVSGSGYIYKTIDGGKTWRKLAQSAGWGCYAIGNTNVWVGKGNCAYNATDVDFRQEVYTSTSGGMFFNDPVQISNSSGNYITDFKMYDANKLGYCIGSGKIFRTLDGGRSWNTLCNTPFIEWEPPSTPTNVNWHEDINIFDRSIAIPMSAGCYGGDDTAQGALAFSPDLGTTWNWTKTNGSMFGTFTVDVNSAWGCGYFNEVYFTTNAGKDWTLLNCGIEPNTNLDDIWFVNDSTGFVCGEGGIYQLTKKQATQISILGDTLNCSNEPVILEVDNKDYYFYKWYKIDEAGQHVLIDSNKTQIEVTQTGTYVVHAYFESELCDYATSAPLTIAIYNNPKPILQLDGEENVICIGAPKTLILLNADKFHADNQWYLDGKLLDSNKQYINPTKPGKYHVVLRGLKGNCSLPTDTIALTISDYANVFDLSENETPFFVDSVKYGKQSFRSLKITNKGDTTMTINNIKLKNKSCFTVPTHQFPIIIPPLASKNIIVCYAPTAIGTQIDTLYIDDYCSQHIVELNGFGDRNIDSTTGVCDTKVIITTRAIKQTIEVSVPMPNPISDIQPEGKINFNIIEKFEDNNKASNSNYFVANEEYPSIKIYNTMGIEVEAKTQTKDIVTTSDAQKATTSGNIHYSLSNLPSGIYFIHIIYHNYSKIFNVIKS